MLLFPRWSFKSKPIVIGKEASCVVWVCHTEGKDVANTRFSTEVLGTCHLAPLSLVIKNECNTTQKKVCCFALICMRVYCCFVRPVSWHYCGVEVVRIFARHPTQCNTTWLLRTVFNWASKILRLIFGSASLCTLLIGSKNLRHFLN